MPHDLNHHSFLPANEDMDWVLDPQATGVDDADNIRPLDFIADLMLSCGLQDRLYLGSINIGKALISGIFMCEDSPRHYPVLSFTVKKSDWNYGKPIFLTALKAGYSGWLTPGRLNVATATAVHTYSGYDKSGIAERCLFRFHSYLTGIVDEATDIELTDTVTLEGVDGLTLKVDETDASRILFELSPAMKKACANGINFFPEFQDSLETFVGSIGGACPDENGHLTIVFKVPEDVEPDPWVIERESTSGAWIGLDVELTELCQETVKEPGISLSVPKLDPC